MTYNIVSFDVLALFKHFSYNIYNTMFYTSLYTMKMRWDTICK